MTVRGVGWCYRSSLKRMYQRGFVMPDLWVTLPTDSATSVHLCGIMSGGFSYI